MRRSLIGIVPDELLNRNARHLLIVVQSGIAAEWPHLLELGQNMLMSSLGIADSTHFVEALQKIRQGADVPIIPLMRTLGIELAPKPDCQECFGDAAVERR